MVLVDLEVRHVLGEGRDEVDESPEARRVITHWTSVIRPLLDAVKPLREELAKQPLPLAGRAFPRRHTGDLIEGGEVGVTELIDITWQDRSEPNLTMER